MCTFSSMRCAYANDLQRKIAAPRCRAERFQLSQQLNHHQPISALSS